MNRIYRLLIAATALFAVPSTALAEQAQTRINIVNAYGHPAAGVNTLAAYTTPDGQTLENGTSTSEVGSTVRVRVRAQGLMWGDSGQTWNATDCPSVQPWERELTFVIQPQSDPYASDPDPANTHTIQIPQIVTQLTEPGISAEEQRFVDLVNAERGKIGAGPLRIAERRSAAADAHATALATIPGIKAHVGEQCEQLDARYADLGGIETGMSNEVVTQILGGCSMGADQAFANFMGSPAHRSTLLGGGYSEIGVGTVDGQWSANVSDAAEQTAYPLPHLPRTKPSYRCTAPQTTADDPGLDESPETTTQKLKKAKLKSLKTKRTRAKLVITGKLSPKTKKVKVTVKVGGKKATARTRKSGKFTVTVRGYVRKGAKVTVSVAKKKGAYKATKKVLRVR